MNSSFTIHSVSEETGVCSVALATKVPVLPRFVVYLTVKPTLLTSRTPTFLIAGTAHPASPSLGVARRQGRTSVPEKWRGTFPALRMR